MFSLSGCPVSSIEHYISDSTADQLRGPAAYRKGAQAPASPRSREVGAALRCLHVIHRYWPALGGSEKFMMEISERLAADGNEVTVFTTDAIDIQHYWLPGKERIDCERERPQRGRDTPFQGEAVPEAPQALRVLGKIPGLAPQEPVLVPVAPGPGDAPRRSGRPRDSTSCTRRRSRTTRSSTPRTGSRGGRAYRSSTRRSSTWGRKATTRSAGTTPGRTR